MNQQSITPPDWPAPRGPYSPALTWEALVFVSGQEPTEPQTGKIIEGDIATRTRQALANVETLLKAAGSSRERVLKINIFLADLNDFQAMNAVYREFFQGCTLPARRTIQAGSLPGQIEIDAIAYRDPAIA